MNDNRSANEEPLNIGAVKTNIGHSEAASGLSAVIKACLTVEKGIIPPIYKLNNPNPNIKWDDWKIKPVTRAMPFPKHLPVKRVSVNSFGYGGTNGHIILEAVDTLVPGYYFRRPKPKTRGGVARKRPHLLLFSAHDTATLRRNNLALSKVVNNYDLHDLSRTLANHRSKLGHRGFAIANCENITNLFENNQTNVHFGEAKGASPVLGFLFTGQGSQWPRMGAELMKYYPSFIGTIRHMDFILGDLPDAPDWTIEDLLLEEAESSRVGEAEFSQPLCIAIQIALVDILGQWGVTPTVTAGHSSGEIAAAYAAGIISASHAIIAAFYRGKVVSKVNTNGAMMAVGLGPEEVAQYLTGYENEVCVACHNSNSLVTLSGDNDALQKIKASLDAEKVFARLVNTGGKAYHSPHMLAVSEEYWSLMHKAADIFASDPPSRPRCVMISSVTNKALGPNASLDETYWSANLTSPVLFTEAVENIGHQSSLNVNLLVEIGPHSSFSGPVRQICTANKFERLAYVPTLVRNQSSAENLLSTAGNLFLKGYNLDLARITAIEKIFPSGKLNLRSGSIIVDLPNYQWNYTKTLWAEPRHSVEHRAPKFPRHDLLGARIPGGSKFEPMWRNMLRIRDVPWLNSHSLGNEAVFPAAGYFSMAIEAIRQLEETSPDPQPAESFILRDISIKKALVTPDTDNGVETMFSMRPSIFSEHDEKPVWWDFNITSFDASENSWKVHCTGSVRASGRSRGETGRTPPAFPQRASGKSWNQGLREVGFDYGPGFRDIDNIRFNGKTYEAAADTIVKQEAGSMEGESRHVLHPGCVDSCLQLIIVSIYAGNLNRMTCGAVPIQVDEVALFPPTQGQLDASKGHAYAWTAARGYRSFHSGCQLLGDDGELLMDISGMRTVAYEAARPQSALEPLKSEPYMASIWKEDAALLGSGKATNFMTGEDLLQLFSFKSSGLSMLQVSSVASLETFPPTSNIDMDITIGDLSEEVPTNLQSAFDMFASHKYVKLDGKGEKEALNATFDLVVAESGALSFDVSGLRRLLKPEGRLLLINAAKNPLEDLTQSGFSMVQTVFVNQTPIVLARVVEAAAEAPSESKSKSFVVAYRNKPTTLTTQISSLLSAHAEVKLQQLSVCKVTGDDHVIVAADLEGPMLPSLTEKELEGLQRISQTCSKVTWLSAGGIMEGGIPEHAMASGLARSLISENAHLNLVTIDINLETTSSTDAIDLVNRCIATQIADASVAEREYAISNDKVYISRVVPDSPLNIVYGPSAEDATLQAVEDTAPIVGNVRDNKVVWTLNRHSRASLSPGHVEIMVLYAGLNHESIQVINGTDYPTTFPMETTGVVSRVGEAVTSIAVGDCVVALYAANMGRFQSVPVNRVFRVKAKREDLLQLASLPMAYGRALYGLSHLARVQPGESVFILSPTGPAGLAAITICKAIGAQVTVILEKDEDAGGLVGDFALADDQIISAAPNLLRRRILERTNNKGPDVIFSCSTVPKSLARECWRYIGHQGRFIDFGRKEVLKRSAIDIVPLHAGAQYLSFDFVEMLQSSSPILTTILADLIEMYEAGKISIMPPKNVVQLQDLDSAVTKFDESFASGKSVLAYSGNQNLSVLPPRPEIQLNPDGTYFLVGCLGGLGRSLTSWMLSKGALRFAFLSRSGADAPSAARLVGDLKSTGAHIDIFRGDVSNLTDVEEAVASIPSAHPVSGVIHAAMVLRDGMFHSMTHANWHTSIGPKVRGTLNLHKALEKAPLDFFLVTSSTSGTLGTPGQTNYAAANAFMDNFARWRHSRGLPATSIVLPMVLGVGVVAENPELEDALKRKGIYGIDESHLLQSFEVAIFSKQTASPTDQLIVGLDPALLAKSVNSSETVDGFWLDDSRFEKLLHLIRKYAGAAGGSAGGDSIKGSILSAPSFDEAAELVVAHFGEKLARLLLLDPILIQPEATAIADYGVDSMIGAELRNWIFKNYSLDVPFQQLLSSNMTITKFAKVVCENLGMKEANGA